MAGARVVAIDGNFDQALGIVRALAEQDDHPVTLVNSVNPFRLEGQKTAAFEICDDLGRAPDVLAIPVGNAGNISAYWAGFREYAAAGIVADDAADVGLPGGRRRADRRRPPDRASGDDRDRDPDRRPGVVGPRRSRRATRRGGRIDAVTDDEILAAYRALAGYEGIFCEPASAASVAGVTQGRGGRRARPRRDRRVRADRPRPQGPDHGRAPGRRRSSRPSRPSARSPSRSAGRDAWPHWLAELDGRRVTVEVPATSANLGAGYDCLGVALALTNRIEARGPRLEPRRDRADGRRRGPRRADRGPRQPIRPRPRGGAPRGPRRAARRASAGGSRCTTRSRSRAASGRRRRRRSAALLAGNALARRGADDRGAAAARQRRSRAIPTTRPPRCSAGSSCRRAGPTDGVEAIRFDAPRDLRAVLFIPELRLSTEEMRAALPATVPLADAVANLGAVAIGVAGLAIGRYELLARLTVDRLHEPYRAAVYPQLPALVEAAREAGAIGACLSGAGSTILAFTEFDVGDHPDRGGVHRGRGRLGPARPVLVVEPRNLGAHVVKRA